MIYNEHSKLEGKHAFLSASKYHWVNYNDLKLQNTYIRRQKTLLGTRLHEFASEAIKMRIKLPRSKKTLNLYVNDAIGYKMRSEQILVYSDNCFGTADAFLFKNNLLRIHDLKTGETKSLFMQLKVYAAIFCLEYSKLPNDIKIELRIYQSDSVEYEIPDPVEILYIMDKIKRFDKLIEEMKLED